MITIICTTGHEVLVSDYDSDLRNFSWFVNSNGYVIQGGDTVTKWTRMHRLVMARKLGRELARHELVDHINGDTLDNRRDNLRLATNSENQFNRDLPAHNTTGYKGVYANPGSKRRPWVAKITVNYKQQYLGSYHTAEAAARAYDIAARKIAGDFARGNLS